MRQSRNSFRHESLQDADSIQDILKAISRGLGKGKVSFSDDDGEILMEPRGLLNLRLTATEDDDQNRISIRITWQDRDREPGTASLKVK